MKRSGIIYPDPGKNEPDNKSVSASLAAGSVVGDSELVKKNHLQNENSNNIGFGVGYDVEGELTESRLETESVSNSNLINSSENAAYPGKASTDYSKVVNNNIYKGESDQGEKSVDNSVTNNYSVNRSIFGVRTNRNAAAQEDSTKKVIQSMKKSPYKSSSDTSRKFSSGNDNYSTDENGDDKDSARDLLTINQMGSGKRLSVNKNSSNDSNYDDSARDLLTVNQMNSRQFSSKKDSRSSNRNNNGNNTRDLLTVSQINSRKSGNNFDVGKEVKKLNEKKVRKRRRSSEKEEKSDGPLINLMFIFEIFSWFSGSDIIVRFIIAAIAGIAGFGIIFTSMGLLDNL